MNINHTQKIVFILNSITITRCIKRVDEFVREGYDVEVYGFERGGELYAHPNGYEISIIGHHGLNQNYFVRFLIILKSLWRLFKKYKEQDVLYYYFFFDVAFCATLLNKRRYIYEESDMPYTNIKNSALRHFMRKADKNIIEKSFLTTMTSEGFVNYHFGERLPQNIIIIPNRVNPELLNFQYIEKNVDINHLSIGFVGAFRYESIKNFAMVATKNFPQHDFHIYGVVTQFQEECVYMDQTYPNFHLHGKFKNPDELPSIYEQLDLVLAAYDTSSINAQYAEPNKMYEAIFFRTPIIVSRGTFLAKKVNSLGIGYVVDALDEKNVVSLIRGLTLEDLENKRNNCAKLPQNYSVNSNSELFDFLSNNL